MHFLGETYQIRFPISMYIITVGSSLRTNQRARITVATNAIFEIGSDEMKM